MRAKLKIDDKVRIQNKKGLFGKGFTPNWTEEVFTVSKVQWTNPIIYKITDYNDEEIQGTFYEQELQKTSQENFRIEKVVKIGNTNFGEMEGLSEKFWFLRSRERTEKTII